MNTRLQRRMAIQWPYSIHFTPHSYSPQTWVVAVCWAFVCLTRVRVRFLISFRVPVSNVFETGWFCPREFDDHNSFPFPLQSIFVWKDVSWIEFAPSNWLKLLTNHCRVWQAVKYDNKFTDVKFDWCDSLLSMSSQLHVAFTCVVLFEFACTNIRMSTYGDHGIISSCSSQCEHTRLLSE